MIKKIFLFLLFSSLTASAFARAPFLETSARIKTLAAGGAEWTSLKAKCDANLTTMIEADYAGFGWKDYAGYYGLCYQVATAQGNTTDATKYGKKALALAKVLARHLNPNLGTDAYQQKVGIADGSTKVFKLPFAPAGGSTPAVYLVPINEVTIANSSGSDDPLGSFSIITKISNTSGGSANYSASDYELHFRLYTNLYRIKWGTGKHPSVGSTYYVSLANGAPIPVSAGDYSILGTTLTFHAAPAAGKAVFYKAISADYEQTGNDLGGVNAVQPDGPGYQMRTFNVGLAYVFDMIYDFSDFTTDLKKEFYNVLNGQIDWYRSEGFEREGGGGISNYFIRGYVTGTMYTAYGSSPINPRSSELQKLARDLIQITYHAIKTDFSSGYSVQGQYWNGVVSDLFSVFTSLKSITGEDLLTSLAWTDNLIPATIQGIKPDRVHQYDGGDWSALPAGFLGSVLETFIAYLPDHAQAGYARQALLDAGSSPTGTPADYKLVYPLAYECLGTGPVYARSDWTTSAVWMSLAATKYGAEHTHRDQGHITIQRGSDYLVVDAGEYSNSQTNPYHNTLLFDDAGVTNNANYPPGQGWWNWTANSIRRFSNVDATRMYAQVDFGASYGRNDKGVPNSVSRARRSVLYIRPSIIIVHDQAQVENPNVVKKIEWNFPARPLQNGQLFSVAQGSSKLFMTSLIPASPSPTITPIDLTEHDSYNYVVSLPTGNLNDNFLHVFEVVSSAVSLAEMPTLVNSTDFEGVDIASGGKRWVSLFAKAGEDIHATFSYNVTTTGIHHHVVTDLAPATGYHVTAAKADATVVYSADHLSDSEGIIEFEFTADSSTTIEMSVFHP